MSRWRFAAKPINAVPLPKRARNEKRLQMRKEKSAENALMKERCARAHCIREGERNPSILSGSVRNGASSVRREVNILSGEPRARLSLRFEAR